MQPSPTRILGLDPGFARTGYALLEASGRELRVVEYGCIETSSHDPYHERLRQLEERVTDLIRRHQPTVAGLEKLFFSKNVKTAIAVGQARGVLIVLLARHNINPYEFAPQEVKLAATGYGNAEKQQVQRMVQILLHLPKPPTPDDAADALAIAVAAAERMRLPRALEVK